MTACVFCSIVADGAEAYVVHETATTLAFLDTRPVFKGHVLVVPRSHVPTLGDLPPADLPAFFTQVQTIAARLPAAVGATGTFVAMNNVVSQSVPHLHCHVVPRTKGDGLRGFFWPRTKYAAGEAAEFAARIAEALR